MSYGTEQKKCSFQRRSYCENVHVENGNNSSNTGFSALVFSPLYLENGYITWKKNIFCILLLEGERAN